MYEIETGAVLPLGKIEALTIRIAGEIVAGKYASAREAAKQEANLLEYAGYPATDNLAKNIRVGNLTTHIAKRLFELGFDKFGKPVSKQINAATPPDLA